MNQAINFVEPAASQQLLDQLEFFSERLALLRGDNLYDVSRLHFAGRGINCVQTKLEVNVAYGITHEASDEHVLNVVEHQILAPVGLKFIRVIMGRLICTDTDVVGALVNVKNNNTKATYDLLGGKTLVGYVAGQFRELIKTSQVPSMTRLSLNGQGQIVTTCEPIAERTRIADISKMYPYLDEKLLPENLWPAFKASSSNVLLLIGPPGTGKSNFVLETMFVRGFDDNIAMADSEAVLKSGGITDYMRGMLGGSVFITEDADTMVRSRERENENMASLLSATNGIISRDTKIIISTNLESLSSVDKALIRPGRCFDVIEFHLLDLNQAIELREMMKLEPVVFPEGKVAFTMSEALNWHEVRDGRKAQHAGVGFRK